MFLDAGAQGSSVKGKETIKEAVQQSKHTSRTCTPRPAEQIFSLLETPCDLKGNVPSSTIGQLELAVQACAEADDDDALGVLIATCNNLESLKTSTVLFKLLTATSKQFPNRSGEIVTAVICGSEDDDPEIRKEAINRVSELAEARRERADEIEDRLIQMRADTSDEVSFYAFRELRKTAELIPARAEEIADKLLEMEASDNRRVNFAAMQNLAQAVRLWPSKSYVIIERLMWWLHSSYAFQGGVLWLLVDVMEWCPPRRIGIAETVLQTLVDYADMKEYDFRSAALCVAVKVAKGCPERVNEIVAALIKITNGPDFEQCVQAMKALTELISPDLDMIEALTDTLISGCSDRCFYVRWDALEQISVALEACPDKSTDIINAIFECCWDEDSRGVESATQQLAKVARLRPERAEEIVEVLLQLCANEKENIRARAVAELSRTTGVCPGKSALIFAKVLYGCIDDNSDVCETAKESLGRVPPVRPDIALEMLERMMHEARNENDVGGSGALGQLGCLLN